MDLRGALEIVHFISGAVVAIAAIVALRQLALTKELAQKAAKREAYKLAAEQCRYYLDDVIPDLNKLNEQIRTKKVTLLAESEVRIVPEGIEIRFPKNRNVAQSLEPIAEALVQALNHLEAFAVMFTSKVAAEARHSSRSAPHTLRQCVNCCLRLLASVTTAGITRASYGCSSYGTTDWRWSSSAKRKESSSTKWVG